MDAKGYDVWVRDTPQGALYSAMLTDRFDPDVMNFSVGAGFTREAAIADLEREMEKRE